MDWMIVVIGTLVSINLLATWAAMRSGRLSARQRMLVVALIWLLPLTGAVMGVAIAVALSHVARVSRSQRWAHSYGGGVSGGYAYVVDGGGSYGGDGGSSCFGGGDGGGSCFGGGDGGGCGGGDGGGGG